MTVEKEKKVTYNIDITKEEQRFCEQLMNLVQNVIAEDVVSGYYKNHENELLINFLEDIANTGKIDVSEYE